MARWRINGTDISEAFGAYLKKGAYENLFLYPAMKDYLTEEVREEHGAKARVRLPRVQARDVQMSFYIVNAADVFYERYEAFLSFLIDSGVFTFTAEKHNRNVRLFYTGAESRSDVMMRGDGTLYCEVSLSFRQTNPYNITETLKLLSEDDDEITAENGENILVELNIYDKHK